MIGIAGMGSPDRYKRLDPCARLPQGGRDSYIALRSDNPLP